MAIFRLRQSGRRLAAVDEFAVPGGLRHRFSQQHSDLTSDGLRSVEAGARQWFRLGARHPKAQPALPSVIVGDFWQEFALRAREYADFCTAAFGQPLPVRAVPADRSRLGLTLRMAQQDEGCAPAALPLIFRVDKELAVAGGRHYLADCGGRGVCYELKGTICLQHLTGPGKTTGRGGNWTRYPAGQDGGSGMIVSCGGGDGS
jgi:hypothetical protein